MLKHFLYNSGSDWTVVGLLTVLQDSYVLKYFESMEMYLSTGSPVYFVVEEGHNYTTLEGQNQICGGHGCPDTSLLGQVYEATRQPNKYAVVVCSYVANRLVIIIIIVIIIKIITGVKTNKNTQNNNNNNNKDNF